MKKALIIFGIILVVLWFGANLGCYLISKHYTYKPALQERMDTIPDKLTIETSPIQYKAFPIMGIKLKLPYEREDIESVNPQLHLELLDEINSIYIRVKDNNESMVITSNKSTISMAEEIQESWFQKVSNKALNIDSKSLNYKNINYARLSDFSWWNLRHNIRLTIRLVLKAMSISIGNLIAIYDVDTPYLNGILKVHEGKTANKINVFSTFTVGDYEYSIDFINANKDNLKNILDILSTVQPNDNTDDSYAELESIYENKEFSVYPEELILTSMISLKNPTVDNLNGLLNIMEKKNYKDFKIENIKKQIEYLERKSKQY